MTLNMDPTKIPDPQGAPRPAHPTNKRVAGSFNTRPPKEDTSHLDEPEVDIIEINEAETAVLTAWRADQIKRLIREKAKRSIEGLKLYEPLPTQHRFHCSQAMQRILRGSNRSGKTLSAAVEVARAVTGQDPHGKWPKTNGRFYLVGKDGKEVGGVMWRKLSRAEAFKMIRDKHTGQWRSFRPLDPDDQARIAESKWAPPLIPRRMIKSIAWENKKENLPSLVVLHNGWELSFFSSLGKPPTGSDIDGCWFDEEIVDPEWYPEITARLLDRRGRFIWSATPQAGTEQLYALHERAEELFGTPNPAVEEYLVLLSDNPHVPEDVKKEFAASLSERDQEIRIGGEFALVSFKVFPEYNRHTHVVPWQEIPGHWTRYGIIDPGRQVCAVLFAAVAPSDEGGHIYCYEELYLKNCNASMFGTAMRDKVAGQNMYAFIIDHHGSRVHDMGAGMTVELQYAAALKQNGVKSLTTGYNFVWGNDDKRAGIEAVRTLLTTKIKNKPRLLVLDDKCPNLDWEFRHFRFKRIKGQATEDAEDRGRVHLMACLRYMAMHPARFVKPPSNKPAQSGAITAFRKKQHKRKEEMGGGTISLGSCKR